MAQRASALEAINFCSWGSGCEFEPSCVELGVHSQSVQLDLKIIHWFNCFSGANWIKRKAASQFKPRLEITIEGDKVKIKTVTMLWTTEDDYTLGEPIEKKMPTGDIEMRVRNSYWVAGKNIGSDSVHFETIEKQ